MGLVKMTKKDDQIGPRKMTELVLYCLPKVWCLPYDHGAPDQGSGTLREFLLT